MRKILILVSVVTWLGVAVYAVADVAVSDSTVRSNTDSIKTYTQNTKDYIGSNTAANGGTVNQNLGKNNATTYSDHGVTVKDVGSVRANQVKQMDIMQGDRKKTEDGAGANDPKLKPLDPKDRDYLNTKANATTYSGSGNNYANTANLPSSYCSDISVTTNNGVNTYACTGTAGFKGAKSSSDSIDARKKLIVDFSSATKDQILVEIEKSSELYAQRVAIFQAMAQEAYARTTLRYEKIQQFLDDIKNSTDPKDIFDLQARVQAEQVMLQNEQNQLLALSQLQQSEKDMYEQRKVELNNFRKKPESSKNSADFAAKNAIVDAGVIALNTGLLAATDTTGVATVLTAGAAATLLALQF